MLLTSYLSLLHSFLKGTTHLPLLIVSLCENKTSQVFNGDLIKAALSQRYSMFNLFGTKRGIEPLNPSVATASSSTCLVLS